MNLLRTATFCASALIACTVFAGVDLSKLPAPASTQGLTFTKNIRPIFEASCFRCHGSERQKDRLRLDSLHAVLKGSKEGPVVVPGESAKSSLVIAVSQLDHDSAMPPRGRALSKKQVALIRAWIDQGAK
ncbi:MAG: c-type cytochrome domain-containing protein [Chthoniobacterales bacterium]